jgi:outer membrane immunogenic protein
VPSATAATTSNADGSAIKTGWTAGGGIAGIVPNNARLTWKIEYLHLDLGSNNFSFVATTFALVPGGLGNGVVAVSNRFTDKIVRVGADYHF